MFFDLFMLSAAGYASIDDFRERPFPVPDDVRVADVKVRPDPPARPNGIKPRQPLSG